MRGEGEGEGEIQEDFLGFWHEQMFGQQLPQGLVEKKGITLGVIDNEYKDLLGLFLISLY